MPRGGKEEIPGSIDNDVTGFSERSQQRGSVKDEVYKNGLRRGRRTFKRLKRFQNRIHAGFGIAEQHLRILFKEQRVLHASITGIH